MENIEECENIKNIETRLRMTRSENSSTRSKKHGPKVKLDPDPSSPDSLDSSSSDSAPKRKKSKKKKKRRKHRKDDSPDPSSSDDSDFPRTVVIGVNNAKIRNIGKRIRSDYAQH